jgi:prevent-host-death family protein
MVQVNIHEAKTHLSMLIEKVSKGESVIIAKAGKPMAKIIPFVAPENRKRGAGFLSGQIEIPKNFDRMGGDEITTLFEGGGQ